MSFWRDNNLSIYILYQEVFPVALTLYTTSFNGILMPRQNGCHFPDIFKWISLDENVGISIEKSLMFVPKGPYPRIGSDNGQATARRKAIIWTNDGSVTNAYMCHSASMSW